MIVVMMMMIRLFSFAWEYISFHRSSPIPALTSKKHGINFCMLLMLLLLTSDVTNTTAEDGTTSYSNEVDNHHHADRASVTAVDHKVVADVNANNNNEINNNNNNNNNENNDLNADDNRGDQTTASNDDVVDNNSNNKSGESENGSKDGTTTMAAPSTDDNDLDSNAGYHNSKNIDDQPITGKVKGTNSWEAYRALLETQRKAQLEAIKQLIGIMNNERQHDMLTVISKKVVEVLSESKATLVTAGFSPSSPFPEDEDLRDGLSKLIQNSLLYADLALRFPTFIHRTFDRTAATRKLVMWCFEFVSGTGVTNGTSAEETIYLASQELKIVEREDNFINPYVKEQEVKLSKLIEEELKKNKKKTKKKKGPRISTRRTEL